VAAKAKPKQKTWASGLAREVGIKEQTLIMILEGLAILMVIFAIALAMRL